MRYLSQVNKRKLSLLAVGMAVVLANPAFALDDRCQSNSYEVAECIGKAPGGLTGQPQEALAFGGVRGKGVIVKNFDYLQTRHLGGTEAEGWGGAWAAGIATYGHMIASTDWSSEYKSGARGVYVDNVKIVGETAGEPIVGIFHYNNIAFIGGQRDILNIDNVKIDVSNTRVKPYNPSVPTDQGKYVVSAINAENENIDKNTVINLDGTSTIEARRTCKNTDPCSVYNLDWGYTGVRASSMYGYSEINLTKNVNVNTYGDSVHGVLASIGTWNNTASYALLNNAGNVTTTGAKANALRAGAHRNIAPTSTINNTGSLKTSGNMASGILVGGTKDINVSNDGAILATGLDSNGVAIQHQSAYEGAVISGNSVIKFDQNSSIYGGDGQGAGLYLTHKDGAHTIDNKGFLTSLNYRSIYDKGAAQGSVSLTNEGDITGYQEFYSVNVKVDNLQAGIFNLEKFDSSAQKLAVVSRFSSNNTGIFNNYADIQFTSSMNDGDTSEGVFTGLQSFYSYEGSMIDLTTKNPLNMKWGVGTNNFVGDRFTVTNDTNNAIFYSVGGTVKLNVDLTTANSATVEERLTDRVIIDNAVTINHKPTLLEIVPTRNSLTKAQNTIGEGFLVVEAKQSDNEAFALAKPVIINGKYYALRKINTNWYLVSILVR